ncbi:MAG: lamin tail domain-containing protein [Actinomycetota bacterium]|nr:lamin tail domain-containing protein [Actinomycetota bacterium]
MGINAPEQGECFNDEGTDHLIQTVKGREVALEIVGTDQFGRTLAHVFTGDDIHVNLQLVESGLAIASTPRDGEPHGPLLLDAEEAAWDRRVGLWAEDACGDTKPLPQLVIASVAFNPSGPDDQVLADETITIANEGSKAVNLTGWVLRDESSRHRYRFPNGRKLEPGDEMVITSADEGWDPGNSPVWNNSGDQAMLLDKQGRVVSRWRY